MPRIGTDEWVAQAEARRERYTGRTARAHEFWDALSPVARFAPLLVVGAFVPVMTSSDFIVRVGVNALLFSLLAVGLNVVVGYAGLLDLGYIAFYGFGAYSYALLSSAQFDIHWPAEASIPAVVAATALLGFLLGLPSRRLVGDYLAIVTLFFGQIFVTVTTNGNRISLPGTGEQDITGGPNGIANVDPMRFFGLELVSITSYFYLALIFFALVVLLLHFLNQSRTGRAWRAFREDPLAAEVMGMPINRLQLLAFAFGAATAGLSGTIFAAVQLGVFPQDFDVPILITLYAMVILGGAGSLGGVVVGVGVLTAILELLRDPEDARWLFYGVVVLALLRYLRPWWRLAAVLAGTVVLGIAVFEIVDSVRPVWTSGVIEGGRLAPLLDGWVVHPRFSERLGNYGFALLVPATILLTRLRGIWLSLALAPVLYLAVFTWENRLVIDPAATRFLLLGALLIVLMATRPQGLLGARRVEIV